MSGFRISQKSNQTPSDGSGFVAMPLLSWELVRGVGRLSLLNRASLAILIIVPVLAQLWQIFPFLQLQIRSAQTLATSAGRYLSTSASGAVISNTIRDQVAVPDSLVSLATHELHRISSMLHDWSSELPSNIALLFFASLFVLLARTVFELACPDSVKLHSLDSYVREKQEAYTSSPSDLVIANAELALSGNRSYSALISEERKHASDVVQESTSRQSIISDLQKTLRNRTMSSERVLEVDALIKQNRSAIRQLRKSENFDAAVLQRRLHLIRGHAATEYSDRARSRMMSLLLSLTCYVLAAFAILWVLSAQSLEIARATGWVAQSQSSVN